MFRTIPVAQLCVVPHAGHCVMPNIAILKQTFDSDFLNAIARSNEMKSQTELLPTGTHGYSSH